MKGRGSAKVAATLLGQAGRQVARTCAAVHGFARGRQAKTLFRGLVGLHLGLGFCFSHDKTRSQSSKRAIRRLCRSGKLENCCRFLRKRPQRHPPPTKRYRQRVPHYIGRISEAKEHRWPQKARITNKSGAITADDGHLFIETDAKPCLFLRLDSAAT